MPITFVIVAPHIRDSTKTKSLGSRSGMRPMGAESQGLVTWDELTIWGAFGLLPLGADNQLCHSWDRLPSSQAVRWSTVGPCNFS
jgi:hypothetical protein